jgi:hypothetical protein
VLMYFFSYIKINKNIAFFQLQHLYFHLHIGFVFTSRWQMQPGISCKTSDDDENLTTSILYGIKGALAIVLNRCYDDGTEHL